jgi:hypothetical protein
LLCLFLFTVEYQYIVSINGHFVYLQFFCFCFMLEKRAVMNHHVKIFGWNFLFLWDKCQDFNRWVIKSVCNCFFCVCVTVLCVCVCVKKLPDCFMEWLLHFTFLLATYESSDFSAFDVIIFFLWYTYVVILFALP